MIYQLMVTINLQTPVVLSERSGDLVLTETKDYFSGTVMRGAFASSYLHIQQVINAQKDEDFYQAFLSGRLQYLPAYPADVRGQRAVPLGFTLLKRKPQAQLDNNTKEIVDLLKTEGPAGYKAFKGMGVLNGNIITQLKTSKNIELHMSRNKDHERITGSSVDGGIYNFESLSAGQDFVGIIQGKKEDLRWFKQMAQTKMGFKNDTRTLYFGRSKYTQYGRCKVDLGEICQVPAWPVISGKSVYLHCVTDFLPQNAMFGTAREAVAEILQIGQATGVRLGRVFASVIDVEGFVAVWGLKRPRQRGLAAGSVIELVRETEWTEAELAKLQEALEGGVGERRQEGYGQFGIWIPSDWHLVEEKLIESITKPAGLPEQVKHTANQIIDQVIAERLRIKAYNDVCSCKNLKGKAHLFAHLENMMKTCHGDWKKLQEDLADSNTTKDNLRKVKVGKYNLQEILTGTAPGVKDPYLLLPYGGTNWSELIKEGSLKALAEEIGVKLDYRELDKSGKLFQQYWIWFSRYARKNKVVNENE